MTPVIEEYKIVFDQYKVNAQTVMNIIQIFVTMAIVVFAGITASILGKGSLDVITNVKIPILAGILTVLFCGLCCCIIVYNLDKTRYTIIMRLNYLRMSILINVDGDIFDYPEYNKICNFHPPETSGGLIRRNFYNLLSLIIPCLSLFVVFYFVATL